VLRAPVWSTWARYKDNVTQLDVERLADEILAHGYPGSQLELDDQWASAYGDFSFDPVRFPQPAQMVEALHAKGLAVTVWVTPFAEEGSAAYVEGAGRGHWFAHANGSVMQARWWRGEGAMLNVSSMEARKWFARRLEALRASVGVDGFKFDAGEAAFVPAGAMVDANAFATAWGRIAAAVGSGSAAAPEVRAAHAQQGLPLWVREFDKLSRWGSHDGLAAVASTALQLGVIGYPWVLPDMVGGNAYARGASGGVARGGGAVADEFLGPRPERELFVRWCAASALLPATQFSIAPWQYDAGVTAACLKAMKLRESRLPQLMGLAEEAAAVGLPIVRPMWWAEPEDDDCFEIADQWLLGNESLVAVVLQKGVRVRDVYLPAGRWRSLDDGLVVDGKRWLRSYPSPPDGHIIVFDRA
jgi:alpha-glucosidase (family GH31 glycosyl hydrolase)